MKQKKAGKPGLWKFGATACGAATLLLLPVDAYSTDVPAWLIVLLCAAMIFCVVMVWRNASGKRLSRILAAIASGIVSVLALYSCFFYPYWNSVSYRSSVPYTQPLSETLTPEQAREDIVYAYQMLRKIHPALRGFVPEELAQAAQEAHGAVRSSGQLSVAEVGQLVQQIASVLDDAHTGINLRNLENQRFLRTSGLHERRGDRLMAVNGVPIETWMEDKASLLSFETPSWERLMLEDYLVSDTGLQLLGFGSGGLEYTYETADGETVTETAAPDDFVTLAVLQEITQAEYPPEEGAEAWVSYEIYPDQSLAVLTLRQCLNTAEFITCLRDMFTEVTSLGIRNVAVDLRSNGGGDSSVATEFMRYLDTDTYRQMGLKLRNGPLEITSPEQTIINERYTDLVFDGDVYVLTSPATFSSAMLFTEYLTDNGLAEQIGETPGNIADGYGEVVTFRLPNSGLLLGISTKQFERLDEEAGRVLVPDEEVPADDALSALLSRL